MKCTNNEGTEVYHPYYNLGNSEITMLSVTDGSTQYTKMNSYMVIYSFVAKVPSDCISIYPS